METISTLILLFATIAAAQNKTVDLFIPTAYEPNVAFAASIIGVCSDKTTYDVQCTRGIFASKTACGPNGPRFTVTEGPDTFIASTKTGFTSGMFHLTESCSLTGRSEATCTATSTDSANFKITSQTATTTFSGPTLAEFYFYKVDITAGSEKLKVAGDACTASNDSSVVTAVLGSLVGAFVFALMLVL